MSFQKEKLLPPTKEKSTTLNDVLCLSTTYHTMNFILNWVVLTF